MEISPPNRSVKVPLWMVVLVGMWLLVTSVSAFRIAQSVREDLATIKGQLSQVGELTDLMDELELKDGDP